MSARKVSSWHGRSPEELRERWGRGAVHLYGKVGSTNDLARELAEEEDAPGGTIVLAREQTEGKGRHGRSWYSPAGAGVYMTMVFRPDTVPNPVLLPVLAGLGLARAFDRAFPELDPALEWPNDLVAAGGKFGGVLAEAVWSEGDVRFLVAGVGIDVSPLGDEAPAEVRESAISLEEALGRELDPAEAADAVVEGLERYLTDPPEQMDAAMLELVDRYDALRDRRVDVRLPDADEPLPGVCVGIAPDGRLLFRPDRGALRRLDRGTIEVLT